MTVLPRLLVSPLAHQRAELAAGILDVMQAAHAQEAQWLQMTHFPPLRQTVQDIQASTHFHLGALQDGRIVGVLVIAPDEDPGQLSITTLVVHASAQRQGVGRSLVQEALRRGPGVVFAVSAATANTAALALYRGLGFEPYRQGLLGTAQLPITKLRFGAAAAAAAANAEPSPQTAPER